MSDVGPARGRNTATDPTGLLIIRAWLEEGSSEPLRAQVRVSSDVSAGFGGRTVTLSRTEDVCLMVGRWLDDMQGDARPPG